VVGSVKLNDVMDEMAALLDTITGLRCFGYPPPTVVPPAGIVSYPEAIQFDLTYGRGMDRISAIPMILVVGKASDRTARNRVAAYAATSGASSVKAVFEAHTWTSCDDLVVTKCSFDVVTIAAVDYIAATFEADAVGKGS
jgi:hypothetical protein